MFLEVYFHKTRRITDIHLVQFLKTILPQNKLPANLDDYISLNDTIVLHCLNSNYGSEEANRLLCRMHFRECFSSKAHPDRHEEMTFDWLEESLYKEFGVQNIYCDEASKSPYVFNKPPLYIFNNNRFSRIEERSSVVKQLKKITKRRIYCCPSLRNEVKQFCNDFWDTKNKKYDS